MGVGQEGGVSVDSDGGGVNGGMEPYAMDGESSRSPVSCNAVFGSVACAAWETLSSSKDMTRTVCMGGFGIIVVAALAGVPMTDAVAASRSSCLDKNAMALAVPSCAV